MKRIILIGGTVVLALVVAGFFFLYSSLNTIVKAAIERIGSDVTGTRVRVRDVRISLKSGEGALRGFRVTNPEGFDDEDAFQFDEISMKLELTSLTQDPVVIEEVVVQGPRIRYEFGGRGTNIRAIQNNVERYAEGSTRAEGPEIVIKSLHFRDGRISVAGADLLETGVTARLPDLHMTDIGTAQGGVTPTVIAEKVLGQLARRVASAVGSLKLDEAGQALEHKAAEKIKGLLQRD